MAASPATLSIPDLERLLVERTKRLEVLIKQRDQLQQQIEQLDQQIQNLANPNELPRRRRPRKFANSAPIRSFLRPDFVYDPKTKRYSLQK